jgi:nicotinate phosphoribosyltransferase
MEKSTALCADRYHAVMGNALFGMNPLKTEKALSEFPATFYVTQRKIPYSLAVGHERMVDFLNRSRADEPRSRFLAEDRAGLKLIAEKLKRSRFPGKVSTVPEGTVIFSGQPIALISGPFAMTQMFEVPFEHAFDKPITLVYLAMKLKEITGDIWASDFSLRRAGDPEVSVEYSKYLYIGGLDDTSNLEAAFLYAIPSIGTMAHYLVQAFMALLSAAVKRGFAIPAAWYDENGNLKHGERLCFENWLDAHPKGTTCLVDTIDLKLGMIHVIEAALSSPERRRALKAVRIDSGDLAKGAIFARAILDANSLDEVKIVLTGDLDHRKVAEIARRLRDYRMRVEIEHRNGFEGEDSEILQKALKQVGIMGVAGGTKLVAEIDTIAGVIFKLIDFWEEPTLKLSGTAGKETLPGPLQTWRCEDRRGRYILDLTARVTEPPPQGGEIFKAIPLIHPFWEQGMYPELKTPEELRDWGIEQRRRFVVPLDEYAETRVKLSSELIRLKDELQEEYLQTPLTKVKMVDWPK